MKNAGIILLICQAISMSASVLANDPLLGDGNFAWILGRYSFGIAGVVLLIIHHRKNKK